MIVWKSSTARRAPSIAKLPIDGEQRGAYQFTTPYDVAVDTVGNLYVADFGDQRIQQYTFSGSTFTNTPSSDGTNYGTKNFPYDTNGVTYNRPSGVAVAPDGSIFLTEHSGHRLIKLTAADPRFGP